MPPNKIVSLVPSLTELLFDLGLGAQVVGRTRFCIHPSEQINQVSIVGGTKNPNVVKIRALSPDLVIANKEENRLEDVDAIREFSEVIITDISTIEDAFDWIQEIGSVLGSKNRAHDLVHQIREHLPPQSTYQPVSAAYFIWKDPWMTIGRDTYIHDVMNRFGLKNLYEGSLRYPESSFEELRALNPQLVLLSSEPFPFKQKHIAELQSHLPKSEIHLVDGEWFSWYGSRMLPSFRKLTRWRNQFG